MANKWYPLFLEALLDRAENSNLDSGTVRLVLLSSSYTYSASHQYASSLTGVLGDGVVLDTKSFTDGEFGFSVPDYPGADLDGQTATQAVIFIDTENPATSRLVLHIDSAPQFPLQGIGEDQPISIDPVPLTDTSGDNMMFPAFAEALLTQEEDADLSGDLKLTFVTAGYTYSSAHAYLSDVASEYRTGAPQTIGNKTFTGGVLSGDPVTFPGTPGINGGVALLAYLEGETDSRLVLLKKTAQGLPSGGLTTTQDQPVRPNSSHGYHRLGAQSS